MSLFWKAPFIFLLVLLFFFAPGCTCGEDDPSTGSGQANDDDDNSTDDDDNDTSDDDDDDDGDDDDVDDDDTIPEYPPDSGEWFGELFIQHVAGGVPGEWGTTMAVSSDGTKYVASTKGSFLFVYTSDHSGTWTREKLDIWAFWPSLAVDSNGKLHLSYNKTDEFMVGTGYLVYATNMSGSWEKSSIDESGDVGEYGSLHLIPAMHLTSATTTELTSP